jgi:hypothetical protein
LRLSASRARQVASAAPAGPINERLRLLEERICRLVDQRIEIGFAALNVWLRICAGTNRERDAVGAAMIFTAHMRLVAEPSMQQLRKLVDRDAGIGNLDFDIRAPASGNAVRLAQG